jgi:hypothetical protein
VPNPKTVSLPGHDVAERIEAQAPGSVAEVADGHVVLDPAVMLDAMRVIRDDAVVFEGHPSLTRLLLWDGFPGHPLRKDFLSMAGGLKSGLSQFPKQVPGQTGQEFQPPPAAGT